MVGFYNWWENSKFLFVNGKNIIEGNNLKEQKKGIRGFKLLDTSNEGK